MNLSKAGRAASFTQPYRCCSSAFTASRTLRATFGQQTKIWQPTQFLPNELSGKSELVSYRGSQGRQSVTAMKSLNFKLEKYWETGPLNIGIHSASKASVVGDQQYFYFGDDTSWFYCFDKGGRLIWRFYAGDSSRGIHSTAALDDKAVYFGSYRGSVYSLDKKTGALLWSRVIGETIGASPLIDDTSITYAVETMKPDGYLIKLDKSNGKTLWQSADLGEQAHSSPSLDKQSGIVVLGANNGTLQGFDFVTGKRLWNTKAAGPIKSTAAIADGTGYVTSWGKDTFSFDVKTGKIKWKFKFKSTSQVSPVYLSGSKTVVSADISGRTVGLDAGTGKLKWQIEVPSFRQLASPTVIESDGQQRILLICRSKTLCMISDAGKILATWPLQNQFSGSPFVSADQIVLIGDPGGIEAFRIIF
ncbi:MAG: hypothetical protein EOP04_21575 [Proteobacteria bacterium]|nr:MAG: hypothetical protein EOP04_21575 [Pseudomonadota bacterium]